MLLLFVLYVSVYVCASPSTLNSLIYPFHLSNIAYRRQYALAPPPPFLFVFHCVSPPLCVYVSVRIVSDACGDDNETGWDRYGVYSLVRTVCVGTE